MGIVYIEYPSEAMVMTPVWSQVGQSRWRNALFQEEHSPPHNDGGAKQTCPFCPYYVVMVALIQS